MFPTVHVSSLAICWDLLNFPIASLYRQKIKPAHKSAPVIFQKFTAYGTKG